MFIFFLAGERICRGGCQVQRRPGPVGAADAAGEARRRGVDRPAQPQNPAPPQPCTVQVSWRE